jgi:hypothetical protein
MLVKAAPERLQEIRWKELLARFVFGGAVTAAAGWAGKKWGPAVGGLFLAFPAILPATVTLVQKHEKSRAAAGAEVAGAVVGTCGLLVFALFVWQLAPVWPHWLTLLLAFLVWTVFSCGLWWLWRTLVHQRRPRRQGPLSHDGAPRRKSTTPQG